MELNYADLYADLENYVPSISAAELMDAPVTPTEYVVKGLLPKGLSILGGAPKVGKSWLVLDLCVRVATGKPLWEMDVQRGTAWYLCLEDTNDRVRQRLACITDESPKNL